MPVQSTAYEAGTEQRVDICPFLRLFSLIILSRYIKELADRLNSLESQIQHPTGSSGNFDFGTISEQNFTNAQSPPRFTRKRTHSMTDDFQEVFSRPSWSNQDRGNCYLSSEQSMLPLLTVEEPALNGNRRTSFGEMSLIGSLVTGSNEDILKA
jgi:hypothetical protein